MRSKNILKIAAFIVAFVFSTAFASLFITESQTESEFVPVNIYESTSYFKDRANSSTALKIAVLIDEDKRNGRESDRRKYEASEDATSPFNEAEFSAYADSVEQYVNASSNLDATDLPCDFKKAWREHMTAWREFSTFLNKMKNSSNLEDWSETEFRDTESYYNKEINRTWYKVIRLGKAYGADVSR